MSKSIDQQKMDCNKNTSTEWSNNLNRCIEKILSKKLRAEAENCNTISDLAKREACHLLLSEKNTKTSSNIDELNQGNTSYSMAINSAYSIIALINMNGASNFKSQCTSKKIFGITAAAGLASDGYLKIQAHKKVDELNNKFKLNVLNNASDSQTKALLFLKDEQETVLDIAEQEKKRNILLTTGYGVAAIMAAYDIVSTNPTCTFSQSDSSKGENPTSLGSKIRKLTDTPIGIIAISAIGSAYSAILWNAADDQIKESQNNIIKIDKVLQTFKDSYANYCPNGRENLNEPKCYCYSDNGKQRADRTKSQTCTALWVADTYKITADAGSYTGTNKFTETVGCLTQNGQFDESCTCKKFVDAKGVNTCMKTTTITIPSELGASFATNSGLQQVGTFFNNAVNGNPKFDLLSSGQLTTNAIASKSMAQKIMTKLIPKLPVNAVPLLTIDSKNISQMAKSILGDKAMQAAGSKTLSAIGIAQTRTADNKISNVLKDAENKAGFEFGSASKGLDNKKISEKDGLHLNISGENYLSGNNSQVQNFPETQKNYNFKNSDITKKNGASLFEIISNRYVQSGLRRLFEN